MALDHLRQPACRLAQRQAGVPTEAGERAHWRLPRPSAAPVAGGQAGGFGTELIVGAPSGKKKPPRKRRAEAVSRLGHKPANTSPTRARQVTNYDRTNIQLVTYCFERNWLLMGSLLSGQEKAAPREAARVLI